MNVIRFDVLNSHKSEMKFLRSLNLTDRQVATVFLVCLWFVCLFKVFSINIRVRSVSESVLNMLVLIGVSHVMRLVHTWSRVHSVTFHWRWSISSGIEVYDMSLAVEWTRQALKMLINLSTWSKLQTL